MTLVVALHMDYLSQIPFEVYLSRNIEPEVLQSGLEVNLLILARRISGKLPAKFSANFDGNFICEFFSLVSPGFQPRPKNSHLKFTSKVVCIPPISLARTQNCFTPIFCFRGRPRNTYFAKPSPTFRQPFLPTFSANPSPSPSFRGPRRGFRNAC